ncbi:hypothetical protein KRMM14A1259_52680 [Krasilnikovia sp. MM14-A1259]
MSITPPGGIEEITRRIELRGQETVLGEPIRRKLDVLIGEQAGLTQAPCRDTCGQLRDVTGRRLLDRRKMHRGQQLQTVRRLEPVDEVKDRIETRTLLGMLLDHLHGGLVTTRQRLDRRELGHSGRPVAEAGEVMPFQGGQNTTETIGKRTVPTPDETEIERRTSELEEVSKLLDFELADPFPNLLQAGTAKVCTDRGQQQGT